MAVVRIVLQTNHIENHARSRGADALIINASFRGHDVACVLTLSATTIVATDFAIAIGHTQIGGRQFRHKVDDIHNTLVAHGVLYFFTSDLDDIDHVGLNRQILGHIGRTAHIGTIRRCHGIRHIGHIRQVRCPLDVRGILGQDFGPDFHTHLVKQRITAHGVGRHLPHIGLHVLVLPGLRPFDTGCG